MRLANNPPERGSVFFYVIAAMAVLILLGVLLVQTLELVLFLPTGA